MPNMKGRSNSNYKHGGCGTKLYEVWCSMRKRCRSATANGYKHYGGRGITVCKEWDADFCAFREWALENGYKDGLSIDRIDVNGNYEPDNCRWATLIEQANNQRNTIRITHNGETRTLHEWAKYLGMKADTLHHRLFVLNWDINRAFYEKVSYDKVHRAMKGGAE